MGRPREFDRDEALDKAMRVFWSRGYDAPTMTELRTAMGLGRQSLYDTFGDKESLFHEALDRYLSMSSANTAQSLDHEDGLAGIRGFLMQTATHLAGDPERMGCLMFNSCMGVAPHDPAVETKIKHGVADMRRRFEAALRRAVEQGSIADDIDIRSTALFLISQLGGMTVLARGGASSKDLRTVAERALAALE